MKQRILRLYNGCAKGKAALCGIVVILYIALVLFSGGSLFELVRFGVAVASYIMLPGMFWQRALNRFSRDLPAHFDVPLGILLGGGFFAVLYCISMRLGAVLLLQMLPPLLGVVWLVYALRDYSTKGAREDGTLRPHAHHIKPHEWMLVLLCAFLLLCFSLYGVAKAGRPAAVGDVLANQDLLWNVGNAASFQLGFPPQDIRFEGVRLHYHYLTELLAGALGIVSGVDVYNIVAFYMQPFMLAAMVLCIYRFARIVWPEERRRPLYFTCALFAFGCASLWKILPNGLSVFWNSNITHMVTNINSQATAVVFLCIFMGLFVNASRAGFKVGVVQYLLLIASFIMLTFSKGPLAALVLVGVVLAVLVGFVLRAVHWRGLVFAVVLAGLFLFIYNVMFASGANDSMTLSITGTLEKGYFANIYVYIEQVWPGFATVAAVLLILLQCVLTAPAQFPLYLRGLFTDIKGFKKLSAHRLLFNALAVGGFAAYFLYNHPHMSQVYFLFGGIFFLTLLAVDAVGTIRWPEGKSLRALLQKGYVTVCAVCAVMGIATAGFLYVHLLGSGARQVARNLGIEEKYPYEVVINSDDEAAALWLGRNTGKDAVFVTNRIHTGSRMEGVSNVYSAFSGRQGYMEGFQYAKTNMGVSDEEINYRLGLVNQVFSVQTPADTVVRILQTNGITHVVFSEQMAGESPETGKEYGFDAGPQFDGLLLVWASDTVRIYEVP